MKTTYLILVSIHGLIHILGFLKGFELKEVKELKLPISKSAALLWLLSVFMILLYAILFYVEHNYAWLVGLIAVTLSQVLVILYWKDAKIGTVPNSIILIVSLFGYGEYSFQKMVSAETKSLFNKAVIEGAAIVTKQDIGRLPKSVAKWLEHSGMTGKEFIKTARISQRAQLKMSVDAEDWYEAEATQYTFTEKPAFIWTVDVTANKLIAFKGRDKLENGKGEMLIELNSLIPIVDEKGPKLDEGSMQRYLGELVWFPSLALSPFISWTEVNDTTAMATMVYNGTESSGNFIFNSSGDFIKFSTMRYKGNEADSKRYEWVLLVEDYKTFGGIKIPSKMSATWKLENQDWTWLKMEILDMKYNVMSERW